MTIEQTPYTPPTPRERTQLDTARVFIERQRRQRNALDEKMERARLERLLNEQLYRSLP